MCLGIPGCVVEWISNDSLFSSARIEFAGLTRVCSMACVPDASVGDYVVVHAGIAISRIDPEAARLALEELQGMGLTHELEEMNHPDLEHNDERKA